MKFTERELGIISEALEDYAVKYTKMRDKEGKFTLRDEPKEALEIFIKIKENYVDRV